MFGRVVVGGSLEMMALVYPLKTIPFIFLRTPTSVSIQTPADTSSEAMCHNEGASLHVNVITVIETLNGGGEAAC